MRKPKYVESPRIPSDTVVVPMRKVLEPTEPNQNHGKHVYFGIVSFWLDGWMLAWKGNGDEHFTGFALVNICCVWLLDIREWCVQNLQAKFSLMVGEGSLLMWEACLELVSELAFRFFVFFFFQIRVFHLCHVKVMCLATAMKSLLKSDSNNNRWLCQQD